MDHVRRGGLGIFPFFAVALIPLGMLWGGIYPLLMKSITIELPGRDGKANWELRGDGHIELYVTSSNGRYTLELCRSGASWSVGIIDCPGDESVVPRSASGPPEAAVRSVTWDIINSSPQQ